MEDAKVAALALEKEVEEHRIAIRVAGEEAAKIIKSQITQEEKLLSAKIKVRKLVEGEHLTPEQGKKQVASLQAAYDKPAIAAAETTAREAQKVKLAIDRETQREAERIARETQKLLGQVARETQRETERVARETQKLLEQVARETERVARETQRTQNDLIREAQRERAALEREGETLTRRNLTAQQLFDNELERYALLLEEGVITQEAFGSALEESLTTLNNNTPRVASLTERLQEYGQTMVYVGGAIAGIFGLTIRQGVQAAAQYETTVASFKTMIGSLEETVSTMGKLSAFAVEAPMTMPQIEQAAMGLIQFGERGDAMIHTLEILGNAAAGTGTHFNLLSSVFNQVRGVGHLLTGDFRQLSTRGVISLQDIAKHFDVTEAAAGKMLSTGKVSFASFKAILESLSKEGGRFHNMMADQSKTLEGQMAKLSDAVGIAIRDIGQKFMPIIKMATGAANSILDYWKDVPEILKTSAAAIMGLTFALGTGLTLIGGWVLVVPSFMGFITTLGGIAWIAAAGQAAASLATGAWTVLMMPASAGLGLMTGAVAAFDVSLATLGGTMIFLEGVMASLLVVVASPIFLLAVGATIIAGAAWLIYGDNISQARKEVEKLKESQKELTKEVDKSQVAAVKKIGDLKGNNREDFVADRVADANEREIMLAKQLAGEEKLLETFQSDSSDKLDMGGGDYSQKIISKQRIAGLKEQLAQLAPIKEEWMKQLKSLNESGVTTELDEGNTERNKGIEKRIRALRIGASDKLFDPSGDRKNKEQLAEMKFEGFNDERINEARRLQDKERKESANDELLSLKEKSNQELSLIGITNKELLVKKYTMEGISKLHAQQLADLQYNVKLAQDLEKIQNQGRDIGLSPHQLRKDQAEREKANPEGMALVDSMRDEEAGNVLKSMQEQYKYALLTNEQLIIQTMTNDGVAESTIKAVEAEQLKAKEIAKVRSMMDSARTETEASLENTKRMAIEAANFTTQSSTWSTQGEIRKSQEDHIYRLKVAGTNQAAIGLEIARNKAKVEELAGKLNLEQLNKGKEIIEALKSPADKLKEELKTIEESKGISDENKAKFAAQRVAEYMQSNPMQQIPENKAVSAGSSEFLKFMRDRRKERIKKTQAKTITETLLDNQNGLTQKILTELEKMGVLSRAR